MKGPDDVGRDLAALRTVKAPDAIWDRIERDLDAPVRGGRRHAPARSTFRWTAAAAAMVVLVAATAVILQPARRSWPVVALEGSPRVGQVRLGGSGRLGVGEWIETDATSRARLEVAGLGRVDVGPDSRVRLMRSSIAGQQLALARGVLDAALSAPPRLFLIETPSAIAADLGCAYRLEVDDAGRGVARVTTGWISLAGGGRESIVPAGASCELRPGEGPGIPIFSDAPAGVRDAMAALDSSPGALGQLLSDARVRDSLTLWHVMVRATPDTRVRVFDRLASLAPPPAGVARDAVLRLERDALRRWRLELQREWLRGQPQPSLPEAWRQYWGYLMAGVSWDGT
ncbi:MAG: FecR domain-containing protein [Acidobacteria bacterium]|nr:FecR domain-containing protein [Acidobacteriota bacterium]